MLLFKEQHVPMILSGAKTQTRRLWPKGCRVKAGNVYQARTKMLDSKATFARVKVLRVWQEYLENISEADAKAEGYQDRLAYLYAFYKINESKVPSNVNEKMLVWCVEFAVVKEGGV